MSRHAYSVLALALTFAAPAFAQGKSCNGPEQACEQIRGLAQEFRAAQDQHDAATATGLFTQEAVLVPPGEIASGRDAVAQYFQQHFAQGRSGEHQGDVKYIRVLGDTAWVVGSWSAVGAGPTGRTSEQYTGNWAAVDVKEGDKWKIGMLAWNITPPSPAATTAANPSLQRSNPAVRSQLNQEGKERIEKEGK